MSLAVTLEVTVTSTARLPGPEGPAGLMQASDQLDAAFVMSYSRKQSLRLSQSGPNLHGTLHVLTRPRPVGSQPPGPPTHPPPETFSLYMLRRREHLSSNIDADGKASHADAEAFRHPDVFTARSEILQFQDQTLVLPPMLGPAEPLSRPGCGFRFPLSEVNQLLILG